MALQRYLEGKTLVITATFRTADTKVLFDPATLTCVVRRADGTEITPAITHPSTGVYRVQFPLDVGGGVWTLRLEATGLNDAEELDFYVRAAGA